MMMIMLNVLVRIVVLIALVLFIVCVDTIVDVTGCILFIRYNIDTVVCCACCYYCL